jgi:propionyl-CoA synthetase
VADRREVQSQCHVLGADRCPRAEEAGSGVHAQVRPVLAQAHLHGRRAARRDDALPGVEQTRIKLGSPSFPVYGYDLRIFREDGSECGANEKGIAAVVPPLPPGCLSTVWGQDERFVSTYFSLFKEPLVYSSFDWAIKDDEGYFTILGRTDDVIIEEAIQIHSAIAEVAVVGVEDKLKGQMPLAFAVVKDPATVATPELAKALEKEVMAKVDGSLGAIARPARVHFVTGLPKTRSGKMLRRSLQALAEGRDPGDLTTIDDPSTIENIKRLLTT